MADGKSSILPRWWVAVTLLGVGVVVGVLLVGLLNAGRPDFATAADQNGATVPRSPATAGQVPVAAEARVNAACLRVINEAESITGVLVNVPGATREVDLQQLDDLVRRLQPLQPRLQQDLRDCKVSADVPDQSAGPTPTGTAVASSSASPSPTSTSSPTSTRSPTSTPRPTSTPS